MSNTVILTRKENNNNNNNNNNEPQQQKQQQQPHITKIRNYKRGIKLIQVILEEIEKSRESKLSITHICNKTCVCYSQIKLVIPRMLESGLLETETHSRYFGRKRQIKQMFVVSNKGRLIISKMRQLETILPDLYIPIQDYNKHYYDRHHYHQQPN